MIIPPSLLERQRDKVISCSCPQINSLYSSWCYSIKGTLECDQVDYSRLNFHPVMLQLLSIQGTHGWDDDEEGERDREKDE